MLTTDKVYNDPKEIYPLALMQRKINPNRLIMFTESKGDNKVYKKTFNEDKILVVPTTGTGVCKKTSELVHSKGVTGCIALIDSDFNKLTSSNQFSYPVIQTDYHDLESYAIHSEAWESVLSEFINIDSMKSDGVDNYNELLKISIGYCSVIGACLHVNNVKSYGIPFTSYTPTKAQFIEKKHTVSQVIQRLKQINRGYNWVPIEEEFSKLSQEFYNSISVSDKHLLASSICISHCVLELIRHNKYKSQNITFDYKVLQKIFRSHVRVDDIKKSKMYGEIINWAKQNEVEL